MDKRAANDSKMRLARIAGQVNGIQKMVDDERNCVDILTQVAAIRSAVDQLGVILLSAHLEVCVTERKDGEEFSAATRQGRQDEIRSSLQHFLPRLRTAGKPS